MHSGRHAERQVGCKAIKQINRQVDDRQTCMQKGRQADIQVGSRVSRQAEQPGRQAGTQAVSHASIQVDRLADRQIGR